MSGYVSPAAQRHAAALAAMTSRSAPERDWSTITPSEFAGLDYDERVELWQADAKRYEELTGRTR